jgi:hypothetical protein
MCSVWPSLRASIFVFSITSRYLSLADISTLCVGELGGSASVPTVRNHIVVLVQGT